MKHEGYKANLLQNARYQVSKAGGTVTLRGEHVYFHRKDNSRCVVWYPVESRVHDLEIADMKEAIEWASGHAPFTLRPSQKKIAELVQNLPNTIKARP